MLDSRQASSLLYNSLFCSGWKKGRIISLESPRKFRFFYACPDFPLQHAFNVDVRGLYSPRAVNRIDFLSHTLALELEIPKDNTSNEIPPQWAPQKPSEKRTSLSLVGSLQAACNVNQLQRWQKNPPKFFLFQRKNEILFF